MSTGDEPPYPDLCARGYSAGWPAGSGRWSSWGWCSGPRRPATTRATRRRPRRWQPTSRPMRWWWPGSPSGPAPAPPAGSGRRCSAPTTAWSPTSRWCWAWPERTPPPGRSPRRLGRPAGRGAVDGRRRVHLGALPAGVAGGCLPGAGSADDPGPGRPGGRGAGAGLPGQGDGGRPGRAARCSAARRRRRPTCGRGRRRRHRRGRHRRGRVGGGGGRVQLRVVRRGGRHPDPGGSRDHGDRGHPGRRHRRGGGAVRHRGDGRGAHRRIAAGPGPAPARHRRRRRPW
jgi:hypothetical protein